MYYIDIELSKLLKTEFINREVDGVEEKGIWIPIDRNFLHYGKKGRLHLRLLMKDMQVDPVGYTHFLALYIPKNEDRKKVIENGDWMFLRFLGKAKPSFVYGAKVHKNVIPLDEALEKDK